MPGFLREDTEIYSIGLVQIFRLGETGMVIANYIIHKNSKKKASVWTTKSSSSVGLNWVIFVLKITDLWSIDFMAKLEKPIQNHKMMKKTLRKQKEGQNTRASISG